MFRICQQIPGPRPRYPFIGNLDIIWTHKPNDLCVFDEIVQSMTVLYKNDGIFRLQCGYKQWIFLFDHRLAQDLLKDNVNIEKPFEYQLLNDWLGRGLLINNSADLWRSRRRLLTPAFHQKLLADFEPIINRQCNIMVERLRGSVLKMMANNNNNSENRDNYVDITDYTFPLALDIISETVMGVSLNAQSRQNGDYIEAVQRVGRFFVERLQRPWLWPNLIYYRTRMGGQFRRDIQLMHRLTRRVIAERLDWIKAGSGGDGGGDDNYCTDRQTDSIGANDDSSHRQPKRLAFLDLLLDIHLRGRGGSIGSTGSSPGLTLEDIREEVDTFMFAGHDTSALCMSWTLYLLGLYPDVQRRLHQELDAQSIAADTDVRGDQLRRMPYLDAVLRESLRLYPPVPIITRDIRQDLVVGGQYTVPAGSSLFVCIGRMHLDSRVYPDDPLQFKPERFLANTNSSVTTVGSVATSTAAAVAPVVVVDPLAYIPFSAGSRNCIGQRFAQLELKIVLAKLMAAYRVESVDTRDKLRLFNAVVSKPVNGLRLKIMARN